MRLSSTHLFVVLLAIIGVIGLSISGFFSPPCAQPLSYRLGAFDDRFNISTSTAQSLLIQAEAVWEDEFGRELFVYDQNADFAVNFIFDDRQQTTNTANEYESTLSDLEMSHGEITGLFKERKRRYEAGLAAYKETQAAYEADLRDYNARVSEWNEKGGAPPQTYRRLQVEREVLDNRLAELEQQQEKVESLRLAVNELVSEGNSLAREYNQTASTFIDRFGESREFNQAIYDGDIINVYQFEGPDDLRLALAHEFGHALGVGHVENPESIMYYLMESQSLGELTMTSEDVTALKSACNYE